MNLAGMQLMAFIKLSKVVYISEINIGIIMHE